MAIAVISTAHGDIEASFMAVELPTAPETQKERFDGSPLRDEPTGPGPAWVRHPGD
jgi:hypothetical protein